MSPKGMQEYVHDKNDAAYAAQPLGGKASYDDLKLPVPQMPNSGVQRTHNGHRPAAQVKQERKASRPPHAETNEQRRYLEDTDASEAVKSSVTSSIKHTNTKTRGLEHHQPSTYQRHEDSDPSTPPEGSDDDDHDLSDDLPEITLRGNGGQIVLTPSQLATMHELDRQIAGRTQTIPFRRVDEDDYPGTTSGRPSVSDKSEVINDEPQRQARAVAQPSQTRHRSDTRPAKPQRSAHPQQLAPFEQQTQEMLAPKGVFKALEASDNMLSEAQSNFAYGKRLVHKPYSMPALPFTAPAARNPPVAALAATATQQYAPNATGQHSTRLAVQPDRSEDRQASQQTRTALPEAHAAPQNHRRQKSRHVSRTTTPVQQHRVDTAPEPELLSPQVRHGEEYGNPEATSLEEDVQLKVELDYNASELYGMDYATLKQAAFDMSPNTSVFTFPDDQPVVTLSEKLDCVSRLQANDQAAFMSTLHIDQWEEAGEWFLDKFGALITKFRAARQEKRKAAHCFEDEIQIRHDAVSKKRRLTEAAMSEMKASGAQVLQGTPKKLRKTK